MAARMGEVSSFGLGVVMSLSRLHVHGTRMFRLRVPDLLEGLGDLPGRLEL